MFFAFIMPSSIEKWIPRDSGAKPLAKHYVMNPMSIG
jgi:hypothetical protein